MVERNTDGEATSNPSRIVNYWYNLDRGWQAFYMGLSITIVLLTMQSINLI